VQTRLSFMDDLPVPQVTVWNQIDDEHKTVVVETIARLIANMITAETCQEQKNDR
jgi:hypothetical protein